VLEEETSDLLEHYGETRDFLFNGIKSLGNLQFEEKKKKGTGAEGIDPTPYFHGKPPPERWFKPRSSRRPSLLLYKRGVVYHYPGSPWFYVL